MKVLTIEILSRNSLKILRHHARRERTQRQERAGKSSAHDLLEVDLSSWKTMHLRKENENEQSALQGLSSGRVGRYEDEEEVKLLLFARNADKPVLASLSSLPSKALEARLRQSAKIRGLNLQFFRLIGNHIAVQVSQRTPTISLKLRQDPETLTKSDVNFLKRLRIKH